MGVTLTGKRVQNTYDSLLKLSDNDNLTGTAKVVGDGLGNDSPIYLSTSKVGIGVTPTYQFQTSGNAKIGANLIVGGNLTVNGSTTIVDSTIVAIGDNMIEMAKDNVSNTMDIGWYGTIVESGTKYVGINYDAGSGITTPTFYIGLGTTEPSSTAAWTVKGKIVIGQIDSTGGTFSGQITIPETPTADAHAASKKYVDDQIGGADKARRVTITVKNTETVALSAGTVVHAHPTAPVPSGNIVQVKKADYDTASLMPAIAILNEDLDAAGGTNDEGEAIMFGFINGIDTSSFSAGDELYVGNDGALTNSKPLLTTQLIQKIAVVMKVDSTNGSIEVFGAGRSNDVPNEVDRDLSIAGTLKVDDYIEIEADSGYGRLEIGGPDGGYIDLKTPFSDDYDLRIITNSSGSEFTGSGDFKINAGNTLTLTLDGSTQDATFAGNLSVNETITTPTNTNLKLQPNGTGHLYLGDSSNGFQMYHYSYLNDGVYTTFSHNSTQSVFGTNSSNGFKFGSPITVSGNIYATGNIRTDGIFVNEDAPDDEVIQFIQSGRKTSLKTFFASSGTGSYLDFNISDSTTAGGTNHMLRIYASDAVFYGDVILGNTVSNPATGFADQSGIGLQYSTTVPKIEVSSDNTSLSLNRTTTGGAGVIADFRYESNVRHSFGTANSYLLGDVGINLSTTPSSTLHVYGSFRTDLDATYHQGILNEYVSTYVTRTKFGRLSTSSNLEIYYDIAGAEEARITRNYTSATLKFMRGTTTDLEINGSGNSTFGGSVTIDSKANSSLAYDVLINIGTSPGGTIGYQTIDQLAANIGASSSSNWVKSGNDIYNTNTANVGVGASPSQAKLDILNNGDYDSHTGHGLAINSNTTDAYTSMYMGADDSVDAAYIQSAGKNTSFTTKKLLLNPNGGSVAIGGTPDYLFHVIDTSYVANSTPKVVIRHGTAPSTVGYDTMVISAQDVPTLVLTETDSSGEQKLSFTVGDNKAVIGTANTSAGMYFNVARSTSAYGYDQTNGIQALHLSNAGNATFAGNVNITDTSKIFFYSNQNSNRYIHASSTNDLTIASDDDINYLSNYNRFFNGASEFARLSGSTDSWVARYGTNFGVGLYNPAAKLDINQAMTNGATAAFTNPHLRLSPSNTVDNTGFVGMTFGTSTANNYGFSWGALRTTSALGGMHLRFHNNSATGTDIFNIDYTGNVTIASTRYIRSDSSGGYLTIQGGATYPGGRIDMYGGSNAAAGIEFLTGGTTSTPTLSMRIDSSGNVSIDRTNPNVGGAPSGTDGRFNVYTDEGSSAWAQQMRHDSTTGNGLFVRAGASSSYYTAYFAGYDESNVHFVVRGDGNVGIGLNNPQFGLSMAQGTGDGSRIGWNDGAGDKRASIICSSSTDALQFHTGTSDTEWFRIASNGYFTFTNQFWQWTALGAGTYNKAVLYYDSSNGWLLENAWTTDSTSGGRRPITLTWRGGFPYGGLKLTGNTRLYTDNTGLGINRSNPSYLLDVYGQARITDSSDNGILYLGETGATRATRVYGRTSPSYAQTGKLQFDVTTWGAGSDYGPTEQMNIEVTGPDTKKGIIRMLPHGGNVIIGGTTVENPNSITTVLEVAAAAPVGLILNDTRDANPLQIENRGAVMHFCHGTTSQMVINDNNQVNIGQQGNFGGNNAYGVLRVSDNSQGLSTMAANSYAISLGPKTTRNATANNYYAGITWNGLMNYGNNLSYDAAPHIWLGAKFHDFPGSERSKFCIGIKSGTGTTGSGNDIPVERLTVDYSGTLTMTGDVVAYSDGRLKDNVKTIESALDKVNKLRGVSYVRNDIEDDSEKIGVIAQEVIEVLPQVVKHDIAEDKYSVAYGNMAGVFIEAIKELTAKVEALENRKCNCNCK